MFMASATILLSLASCRSGWPHMRISWASDSKKVTKRHAENVPQRFCKQCSIQPELNLETVQRGIEWPSSGLERQWGATNGRSPFSLDYPIECEEQNILSKAHLYSSSTLIVGEMPHLGCRSMINKPVPISVQFVWSGSIYLSTCFEVFNDWTLTFGMLKIPVRPWSSWKLRMEAAGAMMVLTHTLSLEFRLIQQALVLCKAL